MIGRYNRWEWGSWIRQWNGQGGVGDAGGIAVAAMDMKQGHRGRDALEDGTYGNKGVG